MVDFLRHMLLILVFICLGIYVMWVGWTFVDFLFRSRHRAQITQIGRPGLRPHTRKLLAREEKPLRELGFGKVVIHSREEVTGDASEPGEEYGPRRPMWENVEAVFLNGDTSDLAHLRVSADFRRQVHTSRSLVFVAVLPDQRTVESYGSLQGTPYDAPPGTTRLYHPDAESTGELYRLHRAAVDACAAPAQGGRTGAGELIDTYVAWRERTLDHQVTRGLMRYGRGAYRPTAWGAVVYTWRSTLPGALLWAARHRRRTGGSDPQPGSAEMAAGEPQGAAGPRPAAEARRGA
jgi:hypothetical protein